MCTWVQIAIVWGRVWNVVPNLINGSLANCDVRDVVFFYYSDVIMGTMASQTTSLTIFCTTVYSGVDQRKHKSSALLASVRGIHRSPVNSLHKGPVTQKMVPFDDVIISCPEHSIDTTWRILSCNIQYDGISQAFYMSLGKLQCRNSVYEIADILQMDFLSFYYHYTEF